MAVIVAEFRGHCISIFSPSGEKIRTFGSKGSAEGQFNGPCAVDGDGDGNILVVDEGNNRIQKFKWKVPYSSRSQREQTSRILIPIWSCHQSQKQKGVHL